MKKIVLILCCLLCAVFVCTACSKGPSVEDFCKSISYENDVIVPTTLTRIDALDEMQYGQSKNNIVFLLNKEATKVIVYNIKTQTEVVVLDVDDVVECEAFEAYGETFVFVVTLINDKHETTIYDVGGQNVFYKESKVNFDKVKCSDYVDLFSVDGSIYRVNKGGSTTFIVNNPFFGEIPTFSLQTESYYYSEQGRTVTVYDKKLNVVYFWEAASDTYSSSINVLNGDNILIQEIRMLPENEKKYDYSRSGNKYELNSMIVNVESGKEKSVKLDFVVSEMIYCSDYKSLTPNEYKDIENIAAIHMIEDKRLNTAESEIKVVSLKAKNGKIDSKFFNDNDNCVFIEPLVSGKFVMYCKNEDEYLINNSGKIIGKVNNLSDTRNESFIYMNDCLYDYNLKCVYDFTASDSKNYFAMLAHSIIMSDDGEYFLYTSAGDIVNIVGTVVSYEDGFYVTRDNGTYRVYDENGNQIGSDIKADSFNVLTTYKDGYFVRVVANGKANYYILAK